MSAEIQIWTLTQVIGFQVPGIITLVTIQTGGMTRVV